MSAVIVVTDRAVHMEEAFLDNDFDSDLPSLKLRIFLAIFSPLIMIDQTFWQCGNVLISGKVYRVVADRQSLPIFIWQYTGAHTLMMPGCGGKVVKPVLC